MLQLTLIRHAKSSWEDPSLSDFDRPLNDRGLHDAPMMGEILRATLAPIDRLLSSPALRAITTARLIAAQLGYPETGIEQEPRLYDASLDTLLTVIDSFDSRLGHCALVAHNPGLSQLAAYLGDDRTGDLPTCAIASFGFDTDDWHAVGRNSGILRVFEYPKKHRKKK